MGFTGDEIMKIVGEWIESLRGRLKECYLKVEHDGKPYTLYLRWSDQWEGKIFMGHYPETEGVLKDRILEDAGVRDTEKDLDKVKEAMITHAEKFFTWLESGKCLRCGRRRFRKIYSIEFTQGHKRMSVCKNCYIVLLESILESLSEKIISMTTFVREIDWVMRGSKG